jgi:2-amino-4-hydroxy-6-hydroxymethyldihydropteridine diphosphokinase
LRRHGWKLLRIELCTSTAAFVPNDFRGVQLNTASMPQIAYLSLGSNVGDRKSHLRDAITRLAGVGTIVAVSSFYETEPVEFTSQAWFLNCAAALETNDTPEQLMASVLAIEQEMGRQRIQKKGPRTIDIDIVLFGDRVVESPTLTIPHPAMHRRRFVLEPLAEIAPQVRHPVLKKTARELLDALPAGQIVRKLGSAPG